MDENDIYFRKTVFTWSFLSDWYTCNFLSHGYHLVCFSTSIRDIIPATAYGQCMVLHIIVKIFEKVGKAQFRPSKILYTIISHIPKFAELLSDYDNNDDDELFCVTVLLWGLFKPWQLTFTCSQPRSLPKVLIISNLRYVASRIWTCAILWIKLCSRDEHYFRNNKSQGSWKKLTVICASFLAQPKVLMFCTVAYLANSRVIDFRIERNKFLDFKWHLLECYW